MKKTLCTAAKSVNLLLLLLFVSVTFAYGQKTPPKEVKHLYSKMRDPNISDDFNSIDWNNKWTCRRLMGDSSQIHIEKEDSLTYVSIKGDASTKLGSGLSSLHSSKYGFYITKWRVKGITNGVKTPWHPSVWAAMANFGVKAYKLDPKPNMRIEIDLMEGFWVPDWSSHVITWKGGDAHVHMVKPKCPDMPTDEWCILGFEYTPEYIAFWRFQDNDWKFVESIPFTSGATITSKQLNYGYRQKVYWILSNIYVKDIVKSSFPDSYLHVDYFYYYPFVFYPNYYWKD